MLKKPFILPSAILLILLALWLIIYFYAPKELARLQNTTTTLSAR